MERIRSRVSQNANIIFGTCYDQSLNGKIHVSIIVGGIQTDNFSPSVSTLKIPKVEEHVGLNIICKLYYLYLIFSTFL